MTRFRCRKKFSNQLIFTKLFQKKQIEAQNFPPCHSVGICPKTASILLENCEKILSRFLRNDIVGNFFAVVGVPANNFLVRIFFFFLFPTSIFSQKTAQVLLQISAADTAVFEKNMENFFPKPERRDSEIFAFPIPDTAAARQFCQKLTRFFWEKSYLTASTDSLRRLDSTTVFAKFHIGKEMRWLKIRPAATANLSWFSAAGFREKLFSDQPIRHDELLKFQEKLLAELENSGYPFAQIWLDSIQFLDDGKVAAVLQIAQNQYFTIKEIKITGDLRLPRGYLENYLALRRGQPYSRKKIIELRERLTALPFAEMTAPPTVNFAGGEATVNLFLKKKKAGRFDFIIGLLPRPDAGDGRVLLTGSLLSDFQNALGRGERLRLELERLRPETQKLDLETSVPYLFGQPFGVAGHLRIFRRDSSWVEATGDFGIQYFLTAGNFFKFFWENRSDFLQKIDTAALISSRRLPPNLDFRQNGFGIEADFSRLDYRFNPRRGWAMNLKTTAGFSNLQRNSEIENLKDKNDPSFSFSTLYDTLAGRTSRFRLEGKGEIYLPVFQRSTVKLAVRGGAILSPDRPVFINEQYRLGGNKLLRGFDEESLFATRFLVGTAEFRLLIGQNAFLAAFSDFGYLENLTDRTRLFLRPIGAGVGLNFETRAGIFGINIAAGQRDPTTGFDFRALKFHLGYVSTF